MKNANDICKVLEKGFEAEKKMIRTWLKGPVAGVMLTGAGLVVLSMNGVDVTGLLGGNKDGSAAVAAPSVDYDTLAEEGIRKILEGTGGYTFDSNLLCAAQEIRDISVRQGSGNKAKTAALNALSDISSRCDFDSSRRKIAGYIKEIAMAI